MKKLIPAALLWLLSQSVLAQTKVDWSQLKNIPPLVNIRSNSGPPIGLSCTATTDAYVDTAAHHLYWCTAANTWSDVSGTAGGGSGLTWNGTPVTWN